MAHNSAIGQLVTLLLSLTAMNKTLVLPSSGARVDMGARITNISLQYRRRAAEVGQQAMESKDDAEMMRLLHQALSWIQLAENEELILSSEPLTGSASN
jgi:hypothetical protein